MNNYCADDTNKLLGIPDLIVKSFEINDEVVIINGECIEEKHCPHCGHEKLERYKGKDKEVRHLDICGRHCYLRFRHSSYHCNKCGLHFIKQISFLSCAKHYTDSFVKHVVDLSRGSSLVHASELLGEPYSNIERIYYTYLLQEDTKKKIDWKAKHIGIDEIAMKKGHKNFILIIYDLDKGQVLDILKDRKKTTLEEYLKKVPKEVLDEIKVVCIDMWKPYRNCLQEILPSIIIVVDRFHVAKELGKAVDKARKVLQKQGKFEKLTGEERKKLYWAARYSEQTLNKKPEYKQILKKAVTLCPELGFLIDIRNEFKAIFDLKRPDIAQKRLSNWLRSVTRSKIAPLIKFLKTFRNWRRWIMYFLPLRYTNAPAEGMNNKIKLIKRLGFGYESFEHFRVRLLHTCGSLG
ncbi:MAG: ISL3 family transposase [Candidatus Brocadiae bacterium]|nr:ISL3 family transposase [Candidatus Brocadiia bacterium]